MEVQKQFNGRGGYRHLLPILVARPRPGARSRLAGHSAAEGPTFIDVASVLRARSHKCADKGPSYDALLEERTGRRECVCVPSRVI